MPSLLERIDEAIRRREEEVRRAQAGGAKIVAQIAAFAPPFELVEAAGCIPLRFLWGGESDLESRGLRFLKNEACSLACDQLRRSAEIFSRDFSLPTFELLVPRAHRLPEADSRTREELDWLGQELTDWAGTPPVDADRLRERIRIWNRARRAVNDLAGAVAQGRLGDLEGLAASRALWILGPEAFLSLYEEILSSRKRGEIRGNGTRPLLLIGPPQLFCDDLPLQILRVSQMGRIAGDVTETGMYPHFAHIAPGSDPLFSLAAYANRFPLACGFKRPDAGYMEAVEAAASRTGAEGILFKGLSFCAPWNHQASRFRRRFGLPFLEIEGDFSRGQESRMRTRIEAFLESLEMRKTAGEGGNSAGSKRGSHR
ncbi:MAG: 2-hydroxyacyl-CoA dehydratase [Planctomycetota bacterium]|jgi:hypothetical protein